MNKKIIIALAFVILCTGFASAFPNIPSSCAISPSIHMPLMPDTDCDGVIDRLDNCPFITNPAQKDSDRNGLGNACDIYFESVGMNPSEFVYNGRAFNVDASILNNRDYNIRNARVSVKIPDLGIESTQYVDNLDLCESETVEFNLRAPACSEGGEYPVFVEMTFTNILGDQEKTGAITTVRIIPDAECNDLMSGNGVLGNTYVDVMEIQDVYKGSEAVFPIKISNREFNSKDYVISVTGLDGWGGYRLTPNSLIIVPSQSDRIADLYISARPDVPPGERVFVVTIKSGEEYQRFLLVANVKEQPIENRSAFFIFGFKIILLMLLAVLIVAAVAVGVSKYISKVRSEAREEYY